MAKAKNPIPAGFHTVTPQLTMDNADSAIAWYKKALGADEVTRAVGPDGKILHATIRVGDSLIMLNDDMLGGNTVKAHGGSPISLWVYVPDCDALFNRAIQAGATVVRPVEDQFWGDRCGTLKDPMGYAWTIATHTEDLTEEEMNARAEEFFKKMAEMAPPQTKAAGAGA